VESKDSDAHQSSDRERIVPYTEAKKRECHIPRPKSVGFIAKCTKTDEGRESFGVQKKTSQTAGQCTRSAHSERAIQSVANKLND
jgi:hypothetical protein